MKTQFAIALHGFIFLNSITGGNTATAASVAKLERGPKTCVDFASSQKDSSTLSRENAESVSELLHRYRQTRQTNEAAASQTQAVNPTPLYHSKKAKFSDAMNGFDVYNPTKPFRIRFKGQELEVMAARVESRDSERSQVMFFKETNQIWSPVVGAPVFQMQDPFITFIDNQLILGGVEIFE